MRFTSEYEARLDAKSRVFVPSVYRKILLAGEQQTLYLRKDIFEDCIVVYPEPIWDEQVKYLESRLNKGKKLDMMVYRRFNYETKKVEIDQSGRILIPKSLIDLTGIVSDVLFKGVYNYFEIWPKEKIGDCIVEDEIYQKKISELYSRKL
jgi:MraZ protein